MMKWGLIRLLIIEVPMLADTLLYYIYMNTTFGYLGIMLLLCMPFVYPSMNRCIAETTEEETETTEEETETTEEKTESTTDGTTENTTEITETTTEKS